MDTSEAIRQDVVTLLKGRGAHAEFESAVADLAPELRGIRAQSAPHTAWQLVEHLRLAQSDILEFTRDPNHLSPKWPDGYWPPDDAPPHAIAWETSIAQFNKDSEAMQALVSNLDTDLTAPLPHGQGQTVVREALLIADHNAYHIGQLVMLRILLNAWKTS